MSETVPDDHAPFPHLTQVGSQTDVLISAFTPGTATATITLTNGSKVTFGTTANPWRPLRAGWHGMVYLGRTAARGERVSTYDSAGRLLATQELYY